MLFLEGGVRELVYVWIFMHICIYHDGEKAKFKTVKEIDIKDKTGSVKSGLGIAMSTG